MSGARYDREKIEAKWQRAWARARLFEARAKPGTKKWFSTVPYPYMSGYQHLGFGIAFLRAEFQSRYRRMAGYNVLHPQAFHCTGLPISGAARRVAQGDRLQLDILRKMGVRERDLKKFADPLHWIEVFPPATIEDLKALGAAVDWRRSFITTDLNPPYDAFVKWQFRRLREGGYVRIGKHPVIWCPLDLAPIQDHDRLEGEGETPAEFTLLKFPIGDKALVAATIRPETVFGQTNLWVDPEVSYVEARVGTETWILNESAVAKLREQGRSVEEVGRVKGSELLRSEVIAPGINKVIPILPAKFIDQARGTGIVTSVPSDAPDDYVALRELQRDDATMARYGLDAARVRAISPLPIIRTPGFGPLPGVEIVERLGIQNSSEREALTRAKEEVYRSGFYGGVMNENCGPFAGMRVEVAKDEVKRQLHENGQADVLWEPSGEVICRCTTRAIVKIVEDQWFLAYGDPEWKARTHRALDGITLYPEAVRKQFHHTIDWLNDWPCTHHKGLGTKLPWDDHWVIESLSDSTVYMAYYTIAHALQGGTLRSQVPWAQRLDDEFFDYVFRGIGDAQAIAKRVRTTKATVEGLRREFEYWYPLDLRHTGKDLVQNHMTFCVFNHVALFPESQWPKGLGVVGYVALGGRKMSKSRGNVWYLRDAMKAFGADLVRIGLAYAGDGLDDPSFDTDFVESIQGRLQDWHRFATSRARTRTKTLPIDRWFMSAINRAIQCSSKSRRKSSRRSRRTSRKRFGRGGRGGGSCPRRPTRRQSQRRSTSPRRPPSDTSAPRSTTRGRS
ncbi:MAG: leucine--tRNA ligase [Methanobacteriota archaeon]|nr:MAG: leucine--tRNA ligase [Euryarchaeota archaeon]